MKVFKFGGASICNDTAIRNLRNIVAAQDSTPLLIVVSAMGKSTNALEGLLSLMRSGQKYLEAFNEFKEYHLKICLSLFEKNHHPIFQELENLFQQLSLALATNQSDGDKQYDQVVCFGELLSTTIVVEFLNQTGIGCEHLDARSLIITDGTFREGKVNWDLTGSAVRRKISKDSTSHYLTQGFIGADQNGNSTTLGREGSDFTAAILAYCLEAESVTIWKDVPGVLNADPDLWEKTVKYQNLSYGEAAEMTYYGASVIHPKTIRPLALKKIPLLVRSFLDPTLEGTTIIDIKHEKLEPAVIFKKNQCLISFQVLDYSFINENKISIIFHLFEQFNIRVNMMQISAISLSVCVDSPDNKMKSLINGLSREFSIFYNDRLELITVKNYQPEILAQIRSGRNILLEQRTRKNYQILVSSDPTNFDR